MHFVYRLGKGPTRGSGASPGLCKPCSGKLALGGCCRRARSDLHACSLGLMWPHRVVFSSDSTLNLSTISDVQILRFQQTF